MRDTMPSSATLSAEARGLTKAAKQAEESGDVTLLNVLLKEKRKLLKGQYERIL